MVKTFKKIRKASNHIYCDERRQTDWKFLQTVRQRAALSHGLTSTPSSWGTQPAGFSHLNSYAQPESVSPRIWSSGMYSVPDMTDTSSNTGISSSDSKDNNLNHALTPTSSWPLSAETSDLPSTPTWISNVFASSSEGSSCQGQVKVFNNSETHPLHEQVSIQGDQLETSCPKDQPLSGLCRHQLDIGTYCEECAEELSPFFGRQDFDTCSLDQAAGENGGTMYQDQIIWAQNSLGNQ